MHRWVLTISDLGMDDKGEYMCFVSNEYGTISWKYTLDVRRKLILGFDHSHNIKKYFSSSLRLF